MAEFDMGAYESVEANQGGGFANPPAGAYVLRIMAVLTEWEEFDRGTGAKVAYHTKRGASDLMGESRVKLVYDIAEGQFAGEYSRDYYMDGGRPAENKAWMHWADYQWEDLGKLKNFNEVLKACNPGFDPVPALRADQWQMFEGKLFGAVLNGTVSTNPNGYEQWRLRCGAQIITADRVRSGDYKPARVTDRRDKSQAGATSAATSYDDIPFL